MVIIKSLNNPDDIIIKPKLQDIFYINFSIVTPIISSSYVNCYFFDKKTSSCNNELFQSKKVTCFGYIFKEITDKL